MSIIGIHHVTAFASDPRRNLDFYSRVLGLRLVKKTVNFDDPTVYHLYFADFFGSPGTVLTFFPYPHMKPARFGTGEVSAIDFAVDAGSLSFWGDRLRSMQMDVTSADDAITFADPDGMRLRIVPGGRPGKTPSPLSHPEHAIERISGVTMRVPSVEPSHTTLLGLGASSTTASDEVSTLAAGDATIRIERSSAPGQHWGAGAVHHVAWRVPDDATHLRTRQAVERMGFAVTPVIDRNYFHSIYFREPGGVVFEVATDNPGFAVDEPLESLGTSLQLPAQYEAQRAQIEAILPKL
jgi:glyoxalase family protein